MPEQPSRPTPEQLERERTLAQRAARILRSIGDLGPEAHQLVAEIEAER